MAVVSCTTRSPVAKTDVSQRRSCSGNAAKASVTSLRNRLCDAIDRSAAPSGYQVWHSSAPAHGPASITGGR